MMRYAMDQLRREGVPEDKLRGAAAQLVGQAQNESNLNPNLPHDGGTGYGIYGARDPGGKGKQRRTEMLKWLAANGYAKNSAEGQMRYMAKEAMTDPAYRRSREVLMRGGTSREDTSTFMNDFERPKNRYQDRSGEVAGAYRQGPSDASQAAGPAGADPMPGGRMGSPYGPRWGRQHKGQDLPAAGGSAFYANQGGKVESINKHGDVTVRLPNGGTQVYRHVSPGSGIVRGAEVAAGQQLGTLRHRDPRSTGPHLHFETRDAQGRPYNPAPTIRAARERPAAAPVATREGRPEGALEEARRQRAELSKPIPLRFEREAGSDQFMRASIRRQTDRELREARGASFSDLGAA
jgi:murein DD-endopeptidase MepM/ murein hydrolase activator NlpD